MKQDNKNARGIFFFWIGLYISVVLLFQW